MAHWNPVDQMQDLINKMGGEGNIKRFLSGELVLVEREISKLLKPLSTISTPAFKKFRGDNFKVDTSASAKVKIGYIGDNFKNTFLQKVEKNISEAELRIYELTQASMDTPILAELGDKAETKLVHLWHLLSKQPNGESGVLLTNGYANIFYIGINGKIWAVYALWCPTGCGYWCVYAGSVEDPYRWYAGGQVFSR